MKHDSKTSIAVLMFLLIVTTGVLPQVASAKQMTLRVRTWWTGMDQLWRKDIFDPYEKANPGIKIDFAAIPWGEYWQKQLLMLASGQCLGDVMLIDAKWTQDAIYNKFMMPLDSYIKRDRINLNQFMQASLREYRKDLATSGTLYGLPLVTSAQVLYYNKDIFAQAGMTMPADDWTWEEALGYAGKFTKDRNGDGRPDQWGFGDDWYTPDCMLKAYGADLINPEFTKATLNNAGGIKALSALVDARRAGSLTDSGAFYQGKVAMQNMGDWHISDFRNLKTKFDWDITVPPAGPIRRASLSYSNGFFIPPFLSADKREEAWKLIKYIVTSPKKTDLGLLFWSLMPAYKPLATSKEYLEGEPVCNRKVVMECNEKYAFTHAYPQMLEWHDKIWGDQFTAALNLKKSPAAALKAAEDGINKVITLWRTRKKL